MKDVWSQVRLKGKPERKSDNTEGEVPAVSSVSEEKSDVIALKPSCWRCPVCKEPLNIDGRSFRCKNRHTFDKAKEGYTNLLLPNKKNSAEPGDSKAMLLGRRAYLERGFYDPLADKLAELIKQSFPDNPVLNILDAGCGEGYYSGRIAEQLAGEHRFMGIDISRSAMRMAGKRYKNMQFAVASNYELPVADNSVDVLLRVFAPVSDTEVARVLKPGGLYLWVHPGEQHLFELRALIYDQPQPHTVANDKTTVDGLVWQSMEVVSYPLHLPDSEAVKGLLSMTPYYWSASREKQAVCECLPELDLRADFRVSVLRKV